MEIIKNKVSAPIEIPAEKIGLPTRGATVHSCKHFNVGDEDTGGFFAGAKLAAQNEYFKLEGVIHPFDETAPNIRFEVSLPCEWNGKLVQFGGGGLNGFVPTTNAPLVAQDEISSPPLAKGYIVFGSDSGHTADVTNFMSCKWAQNREAFENFAHLSLKKTKDVVVYLTELLYGAAPEKVYFYGGSNGGRECMKAIQTYPTDYDGAVCFFPVLYWVLKVLADVRNADVLEKIGGAGMIDGDTHAKIQQIVLDICDGLDGVKDGIVSNIPAAIEKREAVEKAVSEILSPEQFEALKSIISPMSVPFPLAFGEAELPGYPVFEGASIEGLFSSTPEARDAGSVMGGDSVISYIFAQDGKFNPRNFDPASKQARIQEISRWMDAYDSNLDVFREKGGKLILVQGTSDPLVTAHGTTQFYNSLVERYGADEASTFIKYFVVPGYGHGVGGSFMISAGFLATLDNWVTAGTEPQNLVAMDISSQTIGRIRPLCEYPAYPHYVGDGDVNRAESFKKV